MAKRSVEYNNLVDIVSIIEKPMQGIAKEIGTGFDVVVSNPPYEKAVDKDNPGEIDICRTESAVKCEEVIECASKLLRFGGQFYMINKARRLSMSSVICGNTPLNRRKYTSSSQGTKDIDTLSWKKEGRKTLT
jgi:tRNA1(Val) A37 N6-methylase TrmN6